MLCSLKNREREKEKVDKWHGQKGAGKLGRSIDKVASINISSSYSFVFSKLPPQLCQILGSKIQSSLITCCRYGWVHQRWSANARVDYFEVLVGGLMMCFHYHSMMFNGLMIHRFSLLSRPAPLVVLLWLWISRVLHQLLLLGSEPQEGAFFGLFCRREMIRHIETSELAGPKFIDAGVFALFFPLFVLTARLACLDMFGQFQSAKNRPLCFQPGNQSGAKSTAVFYLAHCCFQNLSELQLRD